jgi:hypothetical protein
MSVLDLGLKDGVSTEEFLDAGCTVDTIDLFLTKDFKNPHWFFHKGDVSKFLLEFVDDKQKFDLVYMDISYYDNSGVEFGTKKSDSYEISKYMEDLPLCWELLKNGGKLVINDYINDVGKRSAPRIAFNKFACAMNKPFAVYPTRGGMAVLCK